MVEHSTAADTPAPDRDWASERAIMQESAGDRLPLIAESFQRLTGQPLVAFGAPEYLAEAIWSAPAIVLAHGTQDDPLFFYGNRAALDLFDFSATQFTCLPSRYSAEPLEREERARLLARVTRDNFIPDYCGIRVSRSGKRFRIEQATVWNLVDIAGKIHGQAACFSHFTPVDPGK